MERECYNVPLSVLTVAIVQICRGNLQDGFFCPFSPASLGEHDNGAGTALKGSFNCTNSNRLCGITGQMSDATKLLEHLPVEHGCLCFTGNLNM